MILFKCRCTWEYLIHEDRSKVFGPIIDGLDLEHTAHVMPWEEFDDAYADCCADFERKNPQENLGEALDPLTAWD